MPDGHEGPGSPGVPLFLKQFGAKRTGTNYLRSLIRSNYAEADVVPLMHILGDKHAPPPPFEELWGASRGGDDPAFSFVMGATRYAPPAAPKPEHPLQQDAVRRIAAPLAQAFRQGRLGFVISVKDPYAWLVSMARYCHHTDRASPLGTHLDGWAERQCRVFNDCYAAWRALARECPERCQVVR
ncbi:MAG TPA: hypothetical protein VNP72_00730, partial [Longimicrobium sp.]|nr:hypothetical protein [Longimicrobium sp.]